MSIRGNVTLATGHLRHVIVAAVVAVVVLSLAPSAALASTYHTITNDYSGLCLDDTGWSTQAGTQMQQWSCTGGANQAWNLIQGAYLGTQIVQNKYSGLCLDVYQANFSNGTKVVQWPCSTTDAAQLFFLQSWPVAMYTYGDQEAHVVEVYNWSKSSGGKIDIWVPNQSNGKPGANQLWWVN